jgi:hypothetical protein
MIKTGRDMKWRDVKPKQLVQNNNRRQFNQRQFANQNNFENTGSFLLGNSPTSELPRRKQTNLRHGETLKSIIILEL